MRTRPVGHRLTGQRRRIATALITLGIVGSTAATFAPVADATPSTAGVGIHRVDQLGDLSYQAMFAVGVQVYEYAGVIEEHSSVNPPTYYTVLRKLHTPAQGTPGSRRYGFVGAALPATFAMYPTLGHPSVLAHSSFIFGVNPSRMTILPGTGLSQCLSFTIGPVGPLTGGGALASNTCPS
ncbi:hypothetical protein QNM97_19835 [Gordonia sp. L191]|uniref:hypothetical protein n=1 Tax=Gordonia sp. L191 TaxID=2982699 RepID=UPI0024C02613|nr:hypothetical protein [Gordonia sp. L191]WHU46231.1 hypothetical protein QNM97_19835 [Gordonia sp. L191]